ncbi:MAG: DEAD/DEAH box helicase family protein [Selenomonas sp.]|nr:DEAD/DEAH box helicase family protein [Selenomonas sp.]
MASNFDFVSQEPAWEHIAERAKKAEQGLAVAPEVAAIFGRSAMELSIKWVYGAEGMDISDPYKAGKDRELFSLLKDRGFAEVVGDSRLLHMLDQLRLFGNRAAHGGTPLSFRDGVLSLRILFEFLSWMAYCYTSIQGEMVFDESLLPSAQERTPLSQKELQKQAAEIEKKDAALSQKQHELEEKNRELDEILKQHEALQQELTRLRQERQAQSSFHINPITEAETRKRYIDFDLEAAGWIIGENCRIEEEISGMPNVSHTGFTDYVLYGRDGKPLAIVEAKRTSLDPEKGAKQASLYAKLYEEKCGRRPFIFMTNGLRTIFLDESSGYPRREVFGFFTQDDLQMRMDRRGQQLPLSEIEPNHDIAGRPYQLEAVKAVEESFDRKRRKALIVQATGTGKTRVAISLSDVLFRGGWVKRILFLADRTALVKQAKRSFMDFFASEIPMASLMDSRDDAATARIIFSTYPTMMNAIDTAKNPEGHRFFSPGTFDLIIIDESHRSIYQRYQAIFRYFDAMLLGLTATPKNEVDKNTYRQFELGDGNPTFAYQYDEAVEQGYLVPYRQFERTTELLQKGLHYKDLSEEDKAHYEDVFGLAGDNAPDIENTAFNNYVFNRQTVQMVIQDLLKMGQYVEGGDKLGKTIIFAKNRKHARFIVDIFHEMYPELGDDFIQQVDGSIDYHEQIIDDFLTPGNMPQIAVSVDMLDTGIDVPEILNLVFFKMVRSYSKFWQMIGRGTRLCPDLFGPGLDKKDFYIFDYGGNFEFFSLQGNKLKESNNQPSLTERIFNLQANLYLLLYKDKDTERQAFAQELYHELHSAIAALDDKSFRVAQSREQVEKYRSQRTWASLTADDVAEIEKHISPIIPGQEEDVMARFFDQKIYGLMYDYLLGKDIGTKAQQVEETADKLSSPHLLTIPQIKEKQPFIQQVRYPEYWDKVTLAGIEKVRTELRGLLKFLETENTKIYYTDFTDHILTVNETHTVMPQQTSETYKKKVERYLLEHRENIAVHKLRTNKRLTAADLRELERVLWEDLGTQEDYRHLYGERPVGLMVRKTVGMDRAALEEVFAEFLQEKRLNLRQLDFVKRIIDYLAKNGEMMPQDVKKPAFAGLNNVAQLFKGHLDEVNHIFAKVKEVTNNGTEIA